MDDVKQAAQTLLDAFNADDGRVVMGACFGSAAADKCFPSEAAPGAFAVAMLTAIIDPLDESLDHLRANPASGVAARAARNEGAKP